MENLAAEFPNVDILIKVSLENVVETLSCLDGVYSTNLEPIESEPYSGFIPFTNGGYNGIAYVSFNSARWGNWNCMTKYLADDYEMMAEEFFRQKENAVSVPPQGQEVAAFDELIANEETEAEKPQLPGFPRVYADSLPAHKWRESWETEGDDDCFFLIVRAIYYLPDNSRNESGEPEVYFFAGVNTDFNYGRDSIAWAGGSCFKDAPEYERNVKVADITPELLAQIEKEMIAHFGKC